MPHKAELESNPQTRRGNYTFTGTNTHSGSNTQSGKVTFTGSVVDPVVVFSSTALSLTEAAHGGRTVLVTSGTSTHATATLPLTSLVSSGCRFTVLSGFTGTPTSHGLKLDPASTESINGGTSGVGIKAGTLGTVGSALTVIKANSTWYVVAVTYPRALAATSLIWINQA